MLSSVYRVLNKSKIKYFFWGTAIFSAVLILSVLSVGIGDMDIETADIFSIVFGKTFRYEFLDSIPDNIIAVVWEIRIPRILCAIFVGAGLAVSGCVFQGILQNPLADPYTLGISSGASFGAALAIVFNIIWGIYFPITAAALIFAFLTLILVIAIAKRGSGFETSNLIIAGIIVSSVLSSGISFIKTLAGEDVGAVVFWIMGSLSARGWEEVFLLFPVISVCCFFSFMLAPKLDIMALGDRNAYALGVDGGRLRFVYLLIGSVMTAVCVACCGVIGFIGLIVPHLLRFVFTSKNIVLIPMSALLGALLLLCADNVTRIVSSSEVPVGVITTLIGGPFFIFVFMKRKGRKYTV